MPLVIHPRIGRRLRAIAAVIVAGDKTHLANSAADTRV